jgi:L-fuculose-phosphate aldolase
MTLQSFQNVGKDLFTAGLNNSNSGNLSIRDGDSMLITATGAMLHRLSDGDLIRTSLLSTDANCALASSEYSVHKAIYANTDAAAIVHAHCPHLVALSFLQDHITPMDGEGLYYFPAGIPVLSVKNSIASEEVALAAPNFLGKYSAVLVRGHGLFAVGKDLCNAYQRVSSLEHSAKISFIYNNFKFKLSQDKES